MEHSTENIITYANLIALTKNIVKHIGYDYQAPLEDTTIDELVSRQVSQSLSHIFKKVEIDA